MRKILNQTWSTVIIIVVFIRSIDPHHYIHCILNDSLMIVNQRRISDLNQHSNMNLLLCLHHQILLNSRFFVNDCTSASEKVIRNILNITSFCLILANKWLLCWIANTDADISSIFPYERSTLWLIIYDTVFHSDFLQQSKLYLVLCSIEFPVE